jgi:hypothetical protein
VQPLAVESSVPTSGRLLLGRLAQRGPLLATEDREWYPAQGRQAIPRTGVTGGDFWATHGETLTSASMSLAGLSQLLPQSDGQKREPLAIGRLASWAFMHVGIADPTVNELVRAGLADEQPLGHAVANRRREHRLAVTRLTHGRKSSDSAHLTAWREKIPRKRRVTTATVPSKPLSLSSDSCLTSANGRSGTRHG